MRVLAQVSVDCDSDDEVMSQKLKVRFMAMVRQSRNPFEQRTALPDDLRDALAWIERRTCEEVGCSCPRGARMHFASTCPQVNKERDIIMSQIEAAAEELKASGKVAKWFRPADNGIVKVGRHPWLPHPSPRGCWHAAQVAKSVNGPMLEMLAETTRWHDKKSIEMFRMGAPLFGTLVRSGVGVPVEGDDDNGDPMQLFNDMAGRNARVQPPRGERLAPVRCGALLPAGVEEAQRRSIWSRTQRGCSQGGEDG